jgi:hypothetical protein
MLAAAYFAAAAIAVVAGSAIWGTIHGAGPFHRGTLNAPLLLLDGSISVLAMTGLVLAAAVSERREA